MSSKSTFTAAAQTSEIVGRGPVFYRLNCTALSAGTVEYYFGKETLGPSPRMLMILAGTWTGTVDIEYSVDKVTWTAVPNQSYTANDAKFING